MSETSLSTVPGRLQSSQVCAHRGASGHYPENTQAAFDAAAALGAGWIETDVQQLADGELVIFHDETLGRTASGEGDIREMTWPEVAVLDVGSWKGSEFAGQRPIRPNALIAWQAAAPDRPTIIWEIKCEDGDPSAAQRIAGALAAEIEAHPEHRCVVSSFNREALIAIRPLLPTTPMALIVEALPTDAVSFCREQGLEGLHLDGHQLDATSAQRILSAGLALRCYTINLETEAMRLLEMGVEVIMTDFPERFLTVLDP
ncbi:MAG: glycerophosphodiester phosphodiesterase [Luminiphilus sp.]